MSGSASGPLRFLFDVHVHHGALVELRRKGVDVLHAGRPELGLANMDDAALLGIAREQGRILVARNYQDFAPLVRHLVDRKQAFPGVLFLSPALRQSDAGAHVRALSEWVASAPSKTNPIENGWGWLGPDEGVR